ncbi:hypothetical protein [Butyrivibrio proteoclasticus]|uniref:hypothetical protein n=1 Tax=Butyrivibrio proteoclasticus TaxID=43305 RepID=UPI00047CC464|nr:hypothetical protein [Butyrivibrio proteoclasticus]
MKKRIVILLCAMSMVLTGCSGLGIQWNLSDEEVSVESSDGSEDIEDEDAEDDDDTDDETNVEDWQEVFREIIEEEHEEDEEAMYGCKYDLVYLDDDDVPELVTLRGGFMALYRYQEGEAELIFGGPFGLGSLVEYCYVERGNALTAYGSAGASDLIMYTYVWEGDSSFDDEPTHTLYSIRYYDANGNGKYDEGEADEEYYDQADQKVYMDGDTELTEDEIDELYAQYPSEPFRYLSYEDVLALLK